MARSRAFQFALTLVVLGHFAGAAQAMGRRAAKSEAAVVAAVRERLADDPSLGGKIRVAADGDDVVLSGEAPNLVAKDRACASAETVRGVRSVVDLIQVATDERPDGDVAVDAREILRKSDRLMGANVTVQVSSGLASLGGTIAALPQASEALRLVSAVPGVLHVEYSFEVSPAERRTDDEIRRDVEKRFSDHAWLFNNALHVTVERGEVAVRGSVDSAAERFAAYDVAQVPGAVYVDIGNLGVSRVPASHSSFAARSDENVARAVRAALGPRARVSVRSGVVTLQGRLSDERARREAVLAAESVAGVREVVDRLTVNGERKDAAALDGGALERSDEQIADAIARRIASDAHLSSDHLSVEVREGRAFLKGVVGSCLDRRLAAEHARRAGARAVVLTELAVGPASGPETASAATTEPGLEPS